MKNTILTIIFAVLSGILADLQAQTDYTGSITNPSFETGNATGWTWTGADGYSWIGPNTDGDATKDGLYINGLWNSSIGDAQCAQTITGLPEGFYKVTALLTVSTGRLTNQRLYATSGSTTRSMLYGPESHAAYSATNLDILGATESYNFGGFPETAAENGPFYKHSVVSHVTDGSITIGIRVSGKSNTAGYDFSYTSRGDAGFFKFDNFTLTEVSAVATLDNISLDNGFLDAVFNPTILNYTASLPANTTTVTPSVVPTVEGVTIEGTGPVDISSGSGTSTITVTALDEITQQTYIIQYRIIAPAEGDQQDRLYTNEFPLVDVTLLDGPFKHAQELNIQTLLKYDVDRLLAPYLKEAGLPAKAESYPNWSGLDGHISGHYLSAMAINYAGTGNETCKQRMDYIVSELKRCQDANGAKYPDWGTGYAGGVPSSSAIWSAVKTGDFSNFNLAWVPWYNLHKTYAGLRDAWLYGGNDTAKTVFLSFCDWAIDITSGLTDARMETMLNTEHGGMNEIFADAYQMTGETRYMTAAKRFSHKLILNSMAAHVDNLDNMHANTQVPKAVGFQRIAELTKDNTYINAAGFFWQTVSTDRSLASGGNSRREHFPPATECMDYITGVEGPESCNSYNMLKLTEDLFRADPQAKYADFYERALYNHILSTQHPGHGGYVYFTPARPEHYRVYSAPNEAMWCCVGTGMENHGKYGEFIYTHDHDSLYLNLFIASELNWKAKNLTIRQETSFPEEERSTLVISSGEPVDFTLMVRSPYWVSAGTLKIVVNDDTLDVQSEPQTYIPVQRTWHDGDTVSILLPMHNAVEQLPNVHDFVAIMHGPVLLGARTGTEDLAGLIADDSRWGHIASGSLEPLYKAPIMVSARDSIALNIEPVDDAPLNFTAKALFPGTADTSLVLEPFYKIHDARYMMYWLAVTYDRYQPVLDSLEEIEKAQLELEARTIDRVAPGEQQPEADHNMKSQNSTTGIWQGERYRDAINGGYISYDLRTLGKSDLSLLVRYWGNEGLNRTFDILVDEEKLTTENIVGKWNVSQFFNVEYPIPNSMTEGKDFITVKFQAINASNITGGLYDVRILEPLDTLTSLQQIMAPAEWTAIVMDRNIIVSGLPLNATTSVFDIYGRMLFCDRQSGIIVSIPCTGDGIKIVRVNADGRTSARKVFVQ